MNIELKLNYSMNLSIMLSSVSDGFIKIHIMSFDNTDSFQIVHA
jgi:hypothetical protein